MKIIECNERVQGNKVLTYKLTRSPETQTMKTLVDQRIDVSNYCLYEDEKADKDGVIKTNLILSVMTRQGETFATNSQTFIREFGDVTDIFGEDLSPDDGYIPIKVIQGVSKNDRKFISCCYAD